MSTNAAIGMTMPDGTIKAVYLHWDGYITDGGAGETLAEHYKDREKVARIRGRPEPGITALMVESAARRHRGLPP